jgi:ribosomal protein L40E
LELSFIGNKYLGGVGKALIATIKVEGMFINHIFERLSTLKQLQYDTRYWAHHKLTITKENYPTKTIEIYPNAPFLADGEEMIWQHTVSEVLKNGSKITAIDAVTNYRVFQYRYDVHYGIGIVFPFLEEKTVIVEQPIPETTPIGSYFIYSVSLTGIKDPETNKIAGDITFYGLDKSSITFTQITDPRTLSIAVRRLREAYTIKANELAISVQDERIVCSQCENNNPPDSKYCNKCGSSLSTIPNNF